MPVAFYVGSFDQQTLVEDRAARFRGNVNANERGNFGETIISCYNNAINRARETWSGLLRPVRERRSLQTLGRRLRLGAP
jgi:hypothetical protein